MTSPADRRTRRGRFDARPRARFAGVGHGTAVRTPPPCPDGKLRCPVCRNVGSPTVSGRLRRHRDLYGYDCYNTTPDRSELA